MLRYDTRHNLEVLCGESQEAKNTRQLGIFKFEWELCFDVGIALRVLGMGITSKGAWGLGILVIVL